MSIYYQLIVNSKWPGRMGKLFIGKAFVAWTFWCFIHFPTTRVDPGDFVHELDHVRWFWRFTIGAAVVWAIFSRNWFLLPLLPFAYSLAYGVASFAAWLNGDNPYKDNWFERHADRVAGED